MLDSFTLEKKQEENEKGRSKNASAQSNFFGDTNDQTLDACWEGVCKPLSSQ